MIVALLVLATAGGAQVAGDVVSVTEFAELVADPGGEAEDWQPAFQAAIEEAWETHQPVYVPAGEYKIRKVITVGATGEEGKSWTHNSIQIVGAGQYDSVILQEVETENCIDWTGPTYKDSAARGRLANLTLRGGTTCLNIKWHNYFTLDSCYIVGAVENGVYSEGWSSRFLNSTIRWCKGAGIMGRAHFNNCVIRDCYFSRDGVGIWLSGVHGSRVESCGLELCAKAAISLRGIHGLTINNTYFEGNGYKNVTHLPVEGHANTIHLDYICEGIRIHDCIFRANLDPDGALISIADCRGGHIYDNYFYCSTEHENGIMLRSGPEGQPQKVGVISDLTVERNWFHNIAKPLTEDAEGLIDGAVEAGCKLDLAKAEDTE